LRSFGELGADAGEAFVPDDLIELEACLLGVSALMLDGLLLAGRNEDGEGSDGDDE
jgi:hypothetical protein